MVEQARNVLFSAHADTGMFVNIASTFSSGSGKEEDDDDENANLTRKRRKKIWKKKI